MWVPVSEARDCERAFRTLRKTFIKNAEAIPDHPLGWQGGSDRQTVHWHRSPGVWAVLMRALRGSPRYWCAFGTADPWTHGDLDIDVEINPPLSGINRRIAGAFLRDQTGRIHLAHSGRLGGGHSGIGKSAFAKFYRGNWQEVTWPDRTISAMVVLGPIDNSRIIVSLAQFTRDVARFKREVRNGQPPQLSGSVPRFDFSPEFSGVRRRHELRDEIEAQCWHGAVVSALAELLANRRLNFGNDKYRDLIVTSDKGVVTHLFEIKTDVDTTSLYCAVGQLLMHAAQAGGKRPRMILVVPRDPGSAATSALQKLDIAQVRYSWSGNKPVFDGLDAVL